MNDFITILLGLAIPLYGLLWHNQSPRARHEDRKANKNVVAFLINALWPTKIEKGKEKRSGITFDTSKMAAVRKQC